MSLISFFGGQGECDSSFKSKFFWDVVDGNIPDFIKNLPTYLEKYTQDPNINIDRLISKAGKEKIASILRTEKENLEKVKRGG